MPRLSHRMALAAICLAALRLPAQPAAAARAALVGRVTDSLGRAVRGAEISTTSSVGPRAISDDSGAFRLDSLRPGSSRFTVRRLGYQPVTFTAVLEPGHAEDIAVQLVEVASPLPGVEVSDSGATRWLDSFNRRRTNNRGFFVTREDIVREEANTGLDVARRVPGVRLQRTRTGNYQLVMTRGGSGIGPGGCVPTYFLHGMPYAGTLEDFTAAELEALEFYSGISEIPAELQHAGARNVCGAVVIWTRDPRGKPI